jgi:hypothetical protein
MNTYVFGICGMAPLVRRGLRRPLVEDDLPPLPPSIAVSDDPTMPEKIDAAAAWARERNPANQRRRRRAILVDLILQERPRLCAVGLTLGFCHGLVNSCGRFLVLRLAINAVVDGAPMDEKLWLGVALTAVITLEGTLLMLTKVGDCCNRNGGRDLFLNNLLIVPHLLPSTQHLISDHLSHYLASRMSTLLLSKVSRIGARPPGIEETNLISADVPQLIEQTRIIGFLPSGIAGIVGGLVMLVAFLGLSGIAGLVTLLICFTLNMQLGRKSKGADIQVQQALKGRLRVMKQVCACWLVVRAR